VIVAGSAGGQMLLLAYDTAGNQIWSKVIPGVAEAMDVVIGNLGEIVAVGGSASGAGQGFVVVKHDANFNELWRNTYPARGGALRAAVDAAGNLLVTGAVDTNTGLAQIVLYDWMTLKLDPNGTLLWSRTYGQSTSNNDVPYAVAAGSDGSAFITGEGRTLTTDPSLSAQSTVTLKIAPDGTQAWVANTAASSRGLGVKLSSDGDAFVLGESPQTVFRYPQGGPPNQPPTAIASVDTSAGPAPLNVRFSSVGSADPDGSIAGYAWTFGDGQTSTAAYPAHSYVAGSYAARLTVTDNLGAAATSAPITITASAPPPTPTTLTLASTKVTGGRSTTATVRVSSSVGVTVALASSNPGVASVPASVAIPVGATAATFTVKTSKVKRDTAVTLQASANGVTATASLTVVR
jgi:PKD repeat protein